MINFNDIYNHIEAAVNTEEHPVYCASQLEPVPESFPACYITEAEHRKSRAYVTLAYDDGHFIRNWEVQVFSNKVTDALAECHEIMEYAEDAFQRLRFIETYCGQQQNADPSVTRLVARFTSTIGSADQMPE